MKFKPLSKKYQFDDTLVMDFPRYFLQPIANWCSDLLYRNQQIEKDSLYNIEYLADDFRETLQVNLHEVYPQEWDDAIKYILADTDRTTVILQWCLNFYATQQDAANLEWILANGGSGYAVLKTNQQASEYTKGAYDLVERVPGATKQLAQQALNANEELLKAWRACYGRKPNYNEAVQACQNVLEQLLRDAYLPKDTKAQLGKLITDIRAGKTLAYKGSSIIGQPNLLLDLVDKVPMYRGMHKAGTGKDAKKSDAEYILLSTVYIWSLHQGKQV